MFSWAKKFQDERKPNHFQTSLAKAISCSGNTKAICSLSFCQQNLYFASKWKVTKLTSPVRKQASTLSTAACTTNDIGKVYLSFMPRIISCTDSLVSAYVRGRSGETGRGATDVGIEKEQVKKWSKFFDLPTEPGYRSHCNPNFAQIYIKNTSKG